MSTSKKEQKEQNTPQEKRSNQENTKQIKPQSCSKILSQYA